MQIFTVVLTRERSNSEFNLQHLKLFRLKLDTNPMETDQQKLVISDEAMSYVIKKGGEVVVDYISGDN